MQSTFYHRLFIVTLVYLMVDKTHAQQNNVDYASNLMKAFIDLANNDLGAQEYQNYVNNNLTYWQQTLNGSTRVAQVAASLQSRLDDHTRIIRTLQSTIRNSLSSQTDVTVQSCITISGNSQDPRFGSRVDLTSLCVDGIVSPPVGFYSNVGNTMKENLIAVPTLRRQYYGTENGSLIGYPALRSSNPTADPRLSTGFLRVAALSALSATTIDHVVADMSSWYYSTTSPFAKDVVILVQTSTSMNDVFGKQNMLHYATTAVNVILGGLNSRDRVAVVAFSNKVYSASSSDSCYGQKLTVVNPTTLSQLQSFVDRLQPAIDADPNYTLAYQTAFSLFNSSSSTSTDATKYRSIVLFTNGMHMNDINGTLDAIRDGNRAYRNKVINLVYSFAPDTTGNLASVSKQTRNYDIVGEVASGVFKVLTADDNWRTQLSSYFTRFFNADLNAPVVYSVPYVDQTTNDLIMSLCLPIVKQTVLYGVACVDVTMDTLFSEVTYYQRSYLSYAFLLDGYGRLLIHPLLPRLKTFSPQTSLPYLTQIESGDNDIVATLQQSMMSQTQGQMSFPSRTILPRGDFELKGVQAQRVTHNYFWNQVANTNFSVCIVITDGYLNISLSWNSRALGFPPVNMLKSDLDLSRNRDYCIRAGNVVTRSKTTVHVPPSVFTQPQQYLDQATNSSFYSQLTDYLAATSSDPPLEIKISNLRDIVASTFVLEKHWQNHPADYALNRYIGLKEGIFRTFPGHRVSKNYDPTRRSWYQQAVVDQDSYTLYGPYEDAATRMCCVTIAKAIERQMSNSVVIGVIALDFTVSYFQQFLYNNFPPCVSANHECFVMDESGFVVMHKSFTKKSAQCSSITNQHVTCLEGAIATDMIQRKILRSDTCVSYVNNNRIKFWKVTITSVTTTPSYDVYPIAGLSVGMNVFVVTVDINTLLNSLMPVSCSCNAMTMDDSVAGTCSQLTSSVSNQSDTCEYPCFMATEYANVCNGQPKYSSAVSPCIPPSIPLSGLSINDSAYESLLCSCNSTCSINTPLPPPMGQTTASSTQQSLLPLLALLAIPVIIIIVVVVAIKCRRCSKSTWPKELTDSPIYDLPDPGTNGYTLPVTTRAFTIDTNGYQAFAIPNTYLRTSAVGAQPDGYNSDGENTSGGSSGRDSIGTQTERTPSSTSNVVGGITLV